MTCKDCIHYDACKEIVNHFGYCDVQYNDNDCKHFKDNSKFIEMPCKVGDTVYLIATLGIIECKVAGIHLYWQEKDTRTKRFSYIVGLCNLNFTTRLPLHKFNKTWFLSREQAEAKAKEEVADE